MQLERRLLALGLAMALAACQTDETPTTASASGGRGGLNLDFGSGGDTRDCAPQTAGEGGAPSAGDAALSSCGASIIDYAAQVAPILSRCAGEVCHDFSVHAAVRAFIGAPADECCNQRELIAPGHPERSYLIDKLEGRRLCYGTRMPQNGAPLAAADVATLRAWICQGAVLPD